MLFAQFTSHSEKNGLAVFIPSYTADVKSSVTCDL